MYSTTVEGRLMTLEHMVNGLCTIQEAQQLWCVYGTRRTFHHVTAAALAQLEQASRDDPALCVQKCDQAVEVQFSPELIVHMLVKQDRLQTYEYCDRHVWLHYDVASGVLDVVRV